MLPGPERAAEQREQEGRVGAELVHLAREGLAVARRERLEGGDILLAVLATGWHAGHPASARRSAGRHGRIRGRAPPDPCPSAP